MSEEKRFDWELTEQLADLDMTALPEEERVEPTPWQHLAGKLVWGVILSTITLNFLYLDVILPAIGIILLVQAFRPLRKENGWLGLCHGLAWTLCAARLCTLAVEGTLLPETEVFASLERPVGLVIVAVWLALYFSLWRGLLAIARRAGQERPSAPGAAMLLVWYGALMALALAGAEQMSGFAFILILLIYFLILRSLRKTLHFFEENGYGLQPLQPRVSDGRLTAVWLAAVAAVIALALTFGTRYPMDWQARGEHEQAGYEEAVEHLRTLGMPEEILRDLTGEDLAWLDGAQAVIVSRGGSVVGFSQAADGMIETVNAAVLVERKEGAGRWVMLHHFTWSRMPRVRLAEKVQVMPAYFRDGMIFADPRRPMTGRVLYEAGGTAMAAPFAHIRQASYTSASLFAAGPARDMWASYSIPTEADNFRGYVIYGVECVVADAIQEYRTHYVHPCNYFVYPYDPIAEFRRDSEWSIDTFFGGFLTIHSGKLAE